MNDDVWGSDPGVLVMIYDETADDTSNSSAETRSSDDGPGTDLVRWTEVARTTLHGEGVASGHLDLIFVTPDAMAELNLEHMGEDRPTDVLAFPLDGPQLADDPGVLADGPPAHLGDVVICPDVARQQAPDHSGSLDAELTLLVVHGVLHVLGHDHAEEEERLVMQGRERYHLSRYGFAHPVPAP